MVILTYEEATELCKIATFSPSEHEANEAMRKLRETNPTYHWCMDWDGLVICDKDLESEYCHCFNYVTK